MKKLILEEYGDNWPNRRVHRREITAEELANRIERAWQERMDQQLEQGAIDQRITGADVQQAIGEVKL